MKNCLFALLLQTTLFAVPQLLKLDQYLDLMHSHSSSVGFPGNAQKGELELLNDPALIAKAMEKAGRDVGILYEDRYWIWVNDPLRFPNGNIGIYGRILSRGSLTGTAGCAVLPRFSDGRIALICNFRHATRTWELEVPRGTAEIGEAAEVSAKRELLEETGLASDKLVFLGNMPPDTGQSNAVCAIFLAEINQKSVAAPDESEAIESILGLTIEEIREGLLKGSISMEIRGTKRDVFLRDPFLTFGLIQMDLRGLL